MKHFILTLTSFLFLFTSGVSAKPNVIFIMVDDMGHGDIYNLSQHTRDNGAGGGIAGDGIRNGTEEPFIYTPNIDRMAAEGAKLTRHYTAAPVCAPARGSLLQGRDQGHANIRDNSFDKAIADNHTLGTVMQKAGYYTAIIGKWGVGGTSPTSTGRANTRGFDYFYGYVKHIHGHHHYSNNNGTVVEQTTPIRTGLDHAYSADLWTAKAKQIIIDRAQNHATQPFFIYLAYETPHAQLQVPTQAYPSGSGLTGGIQWPLNTNSGVNDSYIHPDYTSLTNNAAKRHATMIRRLDNCVGDILQTLRDLNIDDNTLVVFTSDNGPHNESGQGGSYTQDPRFFQSYANMEGIKRDDWEAGIREPTFAWWPGHIGDNNGTTPAVNSIRPSAFWDWMPTLVDAAGLTPPAWTSGVSLLPELTGTGTQLDKGYLYSEYNVSSNTPTYTDFTNHGGARRNQMQYLFLKHTDGKIYKGVRYNISNAATDFQIYDVDIDPGEANDLAPSMPTLQQAMKDKVLQVRVNNSSYNRPYSSANVPSVTATVVNGLEYKAFEGGWDWVPETDYLTPSATGTSANLDLAKRTRDDDVALEFSGYIRVTTAGSYTFKMRADSAVVTNASGGMLWIHEANIIDDDFNHSGAEKSATLNLAVGLHPIRVVYKHATGTHDLTLQYSGPSIALQVVPDSALFREGEPLPPGPPTANPDSASATGTDPVSISVLVNDIHGGGPAPLSIESVSSAHFGTTTVSGNSILYTADAGKYGEDQFTYTITNGLGRDTTTVDVNVLVPGGQSSKVLFTDFTGFSTSGTTLSSFSWTSDTGEAANATTSLSITGNVTGFLNATAGTGGTGPAVGVAGNIEQHGPWSTSFTFTPSQSLNIISFEISSYSISNSGSRQSASHPVTWALEISSAVVDFTGNVTETEPGGNAPQAFSIDMTGTTLTAGTNYTFKLTVSSSQTSGNNIALDTLELQATSMPTSDDDRWYYLHFANPAPTQADWDADSSGDGYSNYFAYALGGSPHWFNPAVLPVLETNGAGFDYQYNRRVALSSSAYIVEVSNTLQPPWTPLGGSSAVPHPDLSEFERVTVPIPVDSQTRQFVRLRVVPE